MLITSDPTYPLFPFFAFLGFILVIVPLPWHFQAWNAGTCLYMIWAAVACLNQFINSVVWHKNALNPTPIWCDISSRIMIGAAVAIPAASLCINRRLYKIATTKTLAITRSSKRRAVIEDVTIAMGLPVLQMILEIFVNGHRFDIYEDVGCYPAVYNTWLAYPLVVTWPIVIGLVSAVYCVLTLRAFVKRQAQFNELLAHNSSLTKNRYFRLMTLATTELFCTIPFASYLMYLNLTTNEVQPYKGWDDTHFNYSQVNQFPAVIWRMDKGVLISVELSRWLIVICAWIFFLFFGFADEARRHYRLCLLAIAKVLRIDCSKLKFPGLPLRLSRRAKNLTPSFVNTSKGAAVLPVFIPRPLKLQSTSSLGTTIVDIKVNSETHVFPPPEESPRDEKQMSYEPCFGHAY